MMRLVEKSRYNDILKSFPNIEVPYCITNNKILDGDIYIAIPDGIKVFCWFILYDNENTLFIITLNENKTIDNIYISSAIYNPDLSYGTIMYGTMIKNINTVSYKNNYSKKNNMNITRNNTLNIDNSIITIEDIFIYKNKNICNLNFEIKLFYLNLIFNEDLKNSDKYLNKHIICMANMSLTWKDFLNDMRDLKYKISFIQLKYFKSKKNKLIRYYKQNLKNGTCLRENTESSNNEDRSNILFVIKNTLNYDIYNLYCVGNNGMLELYDVTVIDTEERSIYVNNAFNGGVRDNIDNIEESDDEEEEYNYKKKIEIKELVFSCFYNEKFKKYIPDKFIELYSSDTSNVVSRTDLTK